MKVDTKAMKAMEKEWKKSLVKRRSKPQGKKGEKRSNFEEEEEEEEEEEKEEKEKEEERIWSRDEMGIWVKDVIEG